MCNINHIKHQYQEKKNTIENLNTQETVARLPLSECTTAAQYTHQL